MLAALIVALHPGLIVMAARAVISLVYDHAVAAAVVVAAASAYLERLGVPGRLARASGSAE